MKTLATTGCVRLHPCHFLTITVETSLHGFRKRSAPSYWTTCLRTWQTEVPTVHQTPVCRGGKKECFLSTSRCTYWRRDLKAALGSKRRKGVTEEIQIVRGRRGEPTGGASSRMRRNAQIQLLLLQQPLLLRASNPPEQREIGEWGGGRESWACNYWDTEDASPCQIIYIGRHIQKGRMAQMGGDVLTKRMREREEERYGCFIKLHWGKEAGWQLLCLDRGV